MIRKKDWTVKTLECGCKIIRTFPDTSGIQYCKLHSAAQEMLETLKLVDRWYYGPDANRWMFPYETVENVIKKAANDDDPWHSE